MNYIDFPSYNQVLKAIDKLKNLKFPKLDCQTPTSDLIKNLKNFTSKNFPFFPTF